MSVAMIASLKDIPILKVMSSQNYLHYLLTNKENAHHLFVYRGGVSVFISVMYMCTCIYQCTCPGMFIWKPEASDIVSLNHYSILFFETGSLTEPELIN